MTIIAISPIRTKADHRNALLRIEELMRAKAGTEEADELDVLTDLVEAYERRHCPLPWATASDVLRHLMEANTLTQSDLPEVGTQAVISLILSNKRQLTVRQIKALSLRFKVSPSAFI
jgi:HTH-type transcriptional regulator / antitoxin HigA